MKEWQEFKSLPDDHLPGCESLENLWSRIGNLANFCKLLLVLPHSTADLERLFSIIGKIDTSQHSSQALFVIFCPSSSMLKIAITLFIHAIVRSLSETSNSESTVTE